jgi:hypothetical protein
LTISNIVPGAAERKPLSSRGPKPRRGLDRLDRIILGALRANARVSVQELGRLIDKSPPTALRRRKRLEREGYFTYTAGPPEPAAPAFNSRPAPGTSAWLINQLRAHDPEGSAPVYTLSTRQVMRDASGQRFVAPVLLAVTDCVRTLSDSDGGDLLLLKWQ